MSWQKRMGNNNTCFMMGGFVHFVCGLS